MYLLLYPDLYLFIIIHSLSRVVELTGDVTPDMRAIAQADLIVTTPEKWDGVSRSWQNRSYVQKVAILIIDEIHLLGRGSGKVFFLLRLRVKRSSKYLNSSTLSVNIQVMVLR